MHPVIEPLLVYPRVPSLKYGVLSLYSFIIKEVLIMLIAIPLSIQNIASFGLIKYVTTKILSKLNKEEADILPVSAKECIAEAVASILFAPISFVKIINCTMLNIAAAIFLLQRQKLVQQTSSNEKTPTQNPIIKRRCTITTPITIIPKMALFIVGEPLKIIFTSIIGLRAINTHTDLKEEILQEEDLTTEDVNLILRRYYETDQMIAITTTQVINTAKSPVTAFKALAKRITYCLQSILRLRTPKFHKFNSNPLHSPPKSYYLRSESSADQSSSDMHMPLSGGRPALN